MTSARIEPAAFYNLIRAFAIPMRLLPIAAPVPLAPNSRFRQMAIWMIIAAIGARIAVARMSMIFSPSS
ncbi:MAG: hypothetical protein LUQ47_00235 [Methanotrichaceae archaeon]|nr:hypothetical protein [Methanotrichaceae archaeon]